MKRYVFSIATICAGAAFLVAYTNATTSINTQTVEFEISPSPRSIDYHTMFKNNWSTKWADLRKTTKWFNFHQMSYLRLVTGSPSNVSDANALKVGNNAFYDGKEALQAAQMLSLHNFKVAMTVSSGLGYGATCNKYALLNTAEMAGARAAEFEYNQSQTLRLALESKGKSIERLYVDGPFLRVLKGSQKELSCSTYPVIDANNPMASILIQTRESLMRDSYGKDGAVHVVHEYFKELQKRFPKAGINITVNIVNWKQGKEQDGGRCPNTRQGAVLCPHYGNPDIDLDDIYSDFFDNYYKNGKDYRLQGFQFDAPWSVVSADPLKFRLRIQRFYELLVRKLGQAAVDKMQFSFLVNTEPTFLFNRNKFRNFPFLEYDLEYSSTTGKCVSQSCIANKYYHGNAYLGSDASVKPSFLMTEGDRCREESIDSNDVQSNRCTDKSDCSSRCFKNDEYYFESSQDFGDYLKDSLLRSAPLSQIKNVNLAYSSWHEVPRESIIGSKNATNYPYGDGSYVGFVIKESNRLLKFFKGINK